MESIEEIYLQSCTSSCQMLLSRWNNLDGITLRLLITSHYIPRERVTSFITKPLKKYNKKVGKKKKRKSVVRVPGVPGALLSMRLTAGGCGGSAPGASPGNSPGCWETAAPKWGETSPNWQPRASK